MIDREYALRMARYNRWMNTNLYACAARLGDTQRKEDRGAFFKSLHRTLEHIVYADTAWLYRFTARSIDHLAPGAAMFDDFAVMTGHRARLDEELQAWAASLDEAWLRADFRYYSQAYDAHFSRPAWQLVVHLFNHQAHHRGQATTLLMQFGIDPGPTDLPAMPEDFSPV